MKHILVALDAQKRGTMENRKLKQGDEQTKQADRHKNRLKTD